MIIAFSKIIKFLIDDARNRPWFLALETISTLSGISAAVCLAIYNKDANFYYIWSAYTLSSIGLAFVGYIRKSINILFLMTIYTIINVIGLINLF